MQQNLHTIFYSYNTIFFYFCGNDAQENDFSTYIKTAYGNEASLWKMACLVVSTASTCITIQLCYTNSRCILLMQTQLILGDFSRI